MSVYTSGASNTGYSYEEGCSSTSLPPLSATSSRKTSTSKSIKDSIKAKQQEAKWGVKYEETETDVIPWRDLDTSGKVKRVLTRIAFYGFRLILLALLFYTFVCSLKILTSAFRLLGGKTAGGLFSQQSLLANPICGLMIGVLVTVLVQSSSTSTSIIIALVAANGLTVMQAIPMIMGANIGTSVTNTIVAIGQYNDRDVFRRSFAGATVHDMFNWVSVLILLPVEVISHYLYFLSLWLVKGVFGVQKSDIDVVILDAIVKPLTDKIVKIDKDVIKKIATNESSAVGERVLKAWCSDPPDKCPHLFGGTSLSDAQVGIILLIISLFLLITALVGIVKVLHSTLKGKIGRLTQKVINTDLPGKFAFLTGYIAILVGAVLTFLVQSSSIFTSALTPLVGIGMITVDRMYPLTLGANIGTTATGIIAALSVDDNNDLALQLALCHLFFNITGIIIWYPIPFLRKIPLKMAKKLGNVTSSYRWFAILYLLFMFFIFPLVIFGLSVVGLWLLLTVLIPVISIIIFIIAINVLQSKRPHWLPEKLRNWSFLPEWMRSLKPLDSKLTQVKRFLAFTAERVWDKINHLCRRREENEAFGFTEENLPPPRSSTSSSSLSMSYSRNDVRENPVIDNGGMFMSYL
ncbi:Sodium-dependent phosphate transport protein 2A [Holothuria leucospilota]|uniref:Sodium-dependent phosphate transport protein 2A n=1 Tax=Holothuria leucospilota TaxID=206669 RepID=A0A9Q1C0Q8_HOLLE|nr:Sodium-dependent phosphate transport protein 2A [Holothuria leucospilota]